MKMISILCIDDVEVNLTALNFLIEDYMKDNNIVEYEVDTITNAQEGMDIIKSKNTNIVFLDIRMPIMDGFEFLKILRDDSSISKQPIVVMATALGDDNTIKKEQQLGANAYMVKPISYKVISVMLDKYIEILDADSFSVDDEFDFDFDDLEDENTDISIEDNPLEDIIRRSYEHLGSKEFMESYEYNIDNIEGDLEDLDMLIFDVFESADTDIDLSIEIENIINIFEKYKEFLFKFSELTDLYEVIDYLTMMLKNIEINTLDDNGKHIASMFIKSIVFDLIDFKEKVFTNQEAENIYYLNASIASSCFQLNNALKRV